MARFSPSSSKKDKAMGNILLFIGVFVGAYLFTMGLIYGAVKVFFPFKPVTEADEADKGVKKVIMKVSRTPRSTSVHKVKLANG